MSVDRLAETITGAIATTLEPSSVTISTFSAGMLCAVNDVPNECGKTNYFTGMSGFLQYSKLNQKDIARFGSWLLTLH